MNEGAQQVKPSFCPNCGMKIDETMSFCQECGSKNEFRIVPPVDIEIPQKVEPAEGISISSDGKMRWLYEMNLWKNPTILITVYKVMGLAILICAALLFVVLILGGESLRFAVRSIRALLLLAGPIFVILGILAYIVVTLVKGGKYCVVFDMDENGVNHIEMQKKFNKSQLLAALGVVAGTAAGNLSVVGANLIAGSKRRMYSKFNSVRSIKSNRNRNTIFFEHKIHSKSGLCFTGTV